MATTPTDRHARSAEETAAHERRVQARMDDRDAHRDEGGEEKAMQAGARKYPDGFPEQHIAKPGSEGQLDPQPYYDAPYYKGSGKLDGMTAIVTGGDSGIGRAVATLFAREGADVAVLYLSEHEDAAETKRAVEKEGRKCLTLAGDVSDPAFCRDAVDQTMTAFGKIDILVNNAAFQEHADDISEITDDHFDRTLKTNLYGYFYMAREAL
ncbi:MAG TPA: SDR family NAD(P)-dependent oxidoreductase, partial [Beijerinckiaceae bacterium]